MRKINFWSGMQVASVAFLNVILMACSNDAVTEVEPVERQVSFTYTLNTSNGNSMTRADGDDVFGQFYTKIADGSMTATSYSLKLTEVTTGAEYNFNGKWAGHDMITLRTGKYRVEGTSTANHAYVQEVCSLIFDEEVEIDENTTTIELHANYDCFLLIFTDTEITSLKNYHNPRFESPYAFYTFGEFRYAFVHGALYDKNYISGDYKAYIYGEYSNGSTFRIYTGNLEFEKGKYYVYNSLSNSFTIPEMERGQ